MQSVNEGKVYVRRTLFVSAAVYLAGIYLTAWMTLPVHILNIFCVLCVCAGFVCLRTRRSALLYLVLLMLAGGYCAAWHELCIRDEATQPGVHIEGVVVRKTKDLRVVLSDVIVDGREPLNRPVIVTLMVEDKENEEPPEERRAMVGQRVSGTGRLFEQEEKRNPGGVDNRVLALVEGYELSGYLLPGWTAEGEARFSLHEAFRQMKMAVSSRIEALFGVHAPLFQAILVGDRTHMEQEYVQAMRLSGIAHLLTISGMHLTMIAYAIAALLRRTALGRKSSFTVQTVLLVAYTGMTGCAAGTVRACIMTILKGTAQLTGRRYDPLTALAAAALTMTLVNPVWALSASFQFSFFVVLGIHLLNRQTHDWLKRRVDRLPAMKPIVGLLSMSACAQLSALPMQLLLYGYVPLLALPMNVVCGAFMPGLMIGGWCALLLGCVYFPAGRLGAGVIGLCAEAVERLSIFTADQRWSILRMPAPYAWTLSITALLFVAMSRKFPRRRGRKAACLLLTGILFATYLPRLDPAPQYVQLDVGQGDGAVLRRGREAVLLDVGAADEYAMLRYLRHEGLYVDTVILSHLDEDHAGALRVLLDSEIDISRIMLPAKAGEEEASPAVREALNMARDKQIAIEEAERGDVIETGICVFDVLSPCEGLIGSNERSLVLFTGFAGLRVLSLGDLPATVELNEVPQCDLIKVAHHGSRYATSARLIEEAAPETAIVSVGRNSYGHPHDRVLNDLREHGAQVYRTDEAGCLSVYVIKDGYRVKPFIKQSTSAYKPSD